MFSRGLITENPTQPFNFKAAKLKIQAAEGSRHVAENVTGSPNIRSKISFHGERSSVPLCLWCDTEKDKQVIPRRGKPELGKLH